MAEELFYLVTYDIPDDRRRTRVAKVLEDFGDRVQYSVFELILDTPDRLRRLERRLRKVIDEEKDSVRVYYLCASCRPKVQVIGIGVVSEEPDAYIV